MKILCAGDGFGKGHLWPMWPQLLKEVIDDCEVDNVSEVGAGNEYIMNATINSCLKKEYDIVIVQWTASDRLDIINENQNDLAKLILYDQVYRTKFSNINLSNRLWWLSSASQTEFIKNYHKIYITKEQHYLRSIHQIKYVELFLKNRNIKFMFISAYELDFIHLNEHKILDYSVWGFHEKYKGMEEYAKNFPQYEVNKEGHKIEDYKQPHSKVHLEFIKNVIIRKEHGWFKK